jgi:hypothetical protein
LQINQIQTPSAHIYSASICNVYRQNQIVVSFSIFQRINSRKQSKQLSSVKPSKKLHTKLLRKKKTSEEEKKTKQKEVCEIYLPHFSVSYLKPLHTPLAFWPKGQSFRISHSSALSQFSFSYFPVAAPAPSRGAVVHRHRSQVAVWMPEPCRNRQHRHDGWGSICNCKATETMVWIVNTSLPIVINQQWTRRATQDYWQGKDIMYKQYSTL